MKIQIKTTWDSVLFEHESKNNTVKETVVKAVKSGADLTRADLRVADLTGADLKKIKHHFQIIPDEGSFIAWKALSNGIAKLEIPARARRHNSLGSRKCRASYVKTLEIWDCEGNPIKEGVGRHDNKTVYKVGRLTKPEKYDPNPLVECSGGIHFFVTKQEALDW